ncbi:MAG: hypothetical protein K1X64_08120 [Myxococcaceae bacterium]|nr:hypothetical protein [Myxococcaceae bacterium]
MGPIWAATRLFAKPPTFELEPGEAIVRQVTANHFENGEARGGDLLITNRRLGFRPHRFNVQLTTWNVRHSEIRGAYCEGDRFLVIQGMKRHDWLVVWHSGDLAKEIAALAKTTPSPPSPTAASELLGA